MFSFDCSCKHRSCVTAVPKSPVLLLLGVLTLSSSSASAEKMIPKALTALPPCTVACLGSAEGRHCLPHGWVAWQHWQRRPDTYTVTCGWHACLGELSKLRSPKYGEEEAPFIHLIPRCKGR